MKGKDRLNSLFIIGNGFDLSHGIHTTYQDFHEFLKLSFPNASSDDFIVPESKVMPDGGAEYNDNDVVSFLMRVISNAEPDGDNWSDLENSLGLLEFDEYFDHIPEILDKDGDPDYWKNIYNMEDLASEIVDPTLKIIDLFSDWISTVDVENKHPKSDFEEIINSDSDLFLTFNYTRTLELLYQAKNVCHIHGESGSDILFGHGNDKDNYEENISKYTGAEGALQEIHTYLRKNTADALKSYEDFFDAISLSVNKIYSYGFSFSQVDQVYIKEICNRMSTDNVVWYLNDYDSKDQQECYKNIIRSCGFRGQFKSYNISK